MIPSATSLNLSFVGDTLRLALGSYEYGMVVLNEQVDGRPAEYSFNSTWFPGTSTGFDAELRLSMPSASRLTGAGGCRGGHEAQDGRRLRLRGGDDDLRPHRADPLPSTHKRPLQLRECSNGLSPPSRLKTRSV